MHLRPLTSADLDLVCRHREEMFRESGRPPERIAAMSGPFRNWLVPRLADGRYFGWVIEDGDAPVAGLGMMEIDWPPHPFHPDDDRRGYILNVYVEPHVRRRGLARRLMEQACAEGKRRGLAYLILHATADGRPLYDQLGWTPTAEMALSLPAAPGQEG
jgi:ribosomal protein S18 acetylase RimI-like enzyme